MTRTRGIRSTPYQDPRVVISPATIVIIPEYKQPNPDKMEKGLVVEFLLMRNTLACCFGTVPNMNEWVIVKMKKGVQPMMDVPVAFYGVH